MDVLESPVVLTIDDEKSIRDSFRYFLEDYDYTVVEAENGKAGLERFQESQPDLILLDLRMPEMNGLDVLDWLHEHSSRTPVIIISGTGTSEDIDQAMKKGACGYIRKPIEDLSMLLNVVETALHHN